MFEPVSYFHVLSPDGRINAANVKKGMRYTSMEALEYALDLLRFYDVGTYVIWSDSPDALKVTNPEKLPFCYVADTYYHQSNGSRAVSLWYVDAARVQREIKPMQTLRYFSRF